MSGTIARFASLALALALTVCGVALGAAAPIPTLPGPIAPFGCGA